MCKRNINFAVMTFTILASPLALVSTAFAAGGDITQVETFIRSIIKIIAGLAGIVATGFLWLEVLAILLVPVTPNISILLKERLHGRQ